VKDLDLGLLDPFKDVKDVVEEEATDEGRVLRSKAMMPVSRLPLSLCFSSLLEFGRMGLVTMTIIFVFLQSTSFPLMMNF